MGTMDARPIRVSVVSVHPIVRAGIQTLLTPHSDRVTCVTGGSVASETADVVVYDVFGLHLDEGTDLERAIEHHPGRVLALSRVLQPGLTARAVRMGASAWVSIAADANELLAAIEAVDRGNVQDGSPIGPADLRHRGDDLGLAVALTPREWDVLARIVAGASNREIAEGLYITTNTVKSLIRTAYKKVGASSRSQAVAWGIEHGLPPTDTGATG
jgi:DNA-binding NarL/FixJ family response regulator